MLFKEYEWDDINIEHIARHEVIPQETEEACFNEPLIMRLGKKKYTAYGRSDSGRYIFLVVACKGGGIARIITARDMTKSECGLYNRKRG